MRSDSGIVNLLVLAAHEALDEGVVIGDGASVLHLNDAACRLYGRPREELLAAGSLVQFLEPEEQSRLAGLVAGRLEEGELVPRRFETAIRRPGNETVHVEMSTTALQQGGRLRTMTLIRDIGERRRHQAELERLALHDPLTGLPNRRLLMERLSQLAARATREEVRAAILFMDLNGFKRVNDEHGHAAGDRVLVTVAERLQDVLRSCDTAARFGGDEFVVVCQQVADADAVERLGDRLAAILAEPVAVGAGTSIPVGWSIGARRFGDAPFDPEAILRAADAEMYRAKAGARSPS